jgi:hypothetical protein
MSCTAGLNLHGYCLGHLAQLTLFDIVGVHHQAHFRIAQEHDQVRVAIDRNLGV